MKQSLCISRNITVHTIQLIAVTLCSIGVYYLFYGNTYSLQGILTTFIIYIIFAFGVTQSSNYLIIEENILSVRNTLRPWQDYAFFLSDIEKIQFNSIGRLNSIKITLKSQKAYNYHMGFNLDEVEELREFLDEYKSKIWISTL